MPRPDAPSSDPRAAAVAAYFLGFLTGAAMLWRYPDEPFVRFHAWQSILFSVALALAVAGLDFVPLLGLGLVVAFGVGGAVVWVILCVQAWRGRWFALPLIGDIAFEQARIRRQ